MKRLALASIALLAAAPAFALDKPHYIGSRLTPAAASEATRTIVVNNQTRWVNVDHGETVLFLVDGPTGRKPEVWRFDGIDLRFPFSEVSADAPRGVLVYINQATNPLYQKPHDNN